MKNIGIIIENINTVGGTERATVNLANLLVKSKEYKVQIISLFTTNSDLPYYDLDEHVELIHLDFNCNTKLERITSYMGFIIKSRKILKDAGIDILIGTTLVLNYLMAILSVRCKKIGWEHFSYMACSKYNRKIRKLIYPFLDAIVILTVASSMHYTFVDTKKRYVIPNALSFTCEEKADLEAHRIISVGRLEEQKGYDFLIESAFFLKKELPDWHIEIYGDGKEKEKLLSLCKKYGVENYITIHNFVRNIKDKLLTSSIYVMTSRFEGLPMILLEAQTCGLPIVSFDCPDGPAEIVSPGVDGELVQLGDTKMLAMKLAKIGQDPQLRAYYANNARIAAERFSENQIYQKWHKLFTDLE